MSRSHLYGRILLLLWLLLSISGCQEATSRSLTPTSTGTSTPTVSANTTEADEIVLGAILFQNVNFFATVALGMEEATAEAGASIRFRFYEQDMAPETEWIEQFTAEGVDAIIVSPRVRDSSIPAIAAARAAGVKIVCFNGCFTEEATATYVAAIFETDQNALGYELGTYMVNWMVAEGITEPAIGQLAVTAALDAVRGNGNAGYNTVLSKFYSRDDSAAVTDYLNEQQ